MSQLKDMDGHIPAKAQYYKLLPSPSVEKSVVDTDLETLPLLSVVSGDSSTSLATYVNILPSKSTHSLEGPEQMGSGTYFEMKVDRSPGMSKSSFYNAVNVDHFNGEFSNDIWLLSLQQRQQVSGIAHSNMWLKQTIKTCFLSGSSQ